MVGYERQRRVEVALKSFLLDASCKDVCSPTMSVTSTTTTTMACKSYMIAVNNAEIVCSDRIAPNVREFRNSLKMYYMGIKTISVSLS